MRQSWLMSLAEPVTDVVAGFGIAIDLQLLVFPIVGLQGSLAHPTRSTRPIVTGAKELAQGALLLTVAR